MTLVLLALALPLSRQSPREPRFGRMFLAILTFYFYYLLLAICRGQIVKGHWHHSFPMWMVTLMVLAIAARMFQNQYSPRKPRKAAA